MTKQRTRLAQEASSMNKNNGRLDAVGGAEAFSPGDGMRGGARVYLRDFTFLSPEQEGQMLSLERRQCFDSFYCSGHR